MTNYVHSLFVMPMIEVGKDLHQKERQKLSFIFGIGEVGTLLESLVGKGNVKGGERIQR